jgi:hypothetical protein
MHRPIGAIIGLAVAIATPIASSHAQQPVRLEFAPEPGSTYRSEQRIEARNQAWVGAHDDRTNTLRRDHTSKTVVASTRVLRREPDGSTTIEQRMLSLVQDVTQFNARDGERRSRFDSEHPDPNQPPEFAQFLADFRRIVATTTLDPTNEQLAYRVEPEGNQLSQTLALAQSQRSNGTVLIFPSHPVSPGDSWPLARGTIPAQIMGLGNGRIEYPVEATLVAIQSRGGRSHALVRLRNGQPVHVKDNENAGPGLSSLRFEVLYEYDMQLRRYVDFRVDVALQLFAPQDGNMLNLEEAFVIRDRDPDNGGWMIRE